MNPCSSPMNTARGAASWRRGSLNALRTARSAATPGGLSSGSWYTNIRIRSRNAAVSATPITEQPRKTLASIADVLQGSTNTSGASLAVEFASSGVSAVALPNGHASLPHMRSRLPSVRNSVSSAGCGNSASSGTISVNPPHWVYYSGEAPTLLRVP
jgi:hypothetical protein